MTAPAVQTFQLSRNFGRLKALDAVDLSIPRRSVYGLLGPNGAGKSTLLSILINALEPSSGRAEVLGIDTQALRARDFTKIGYVAEAQELPNWMTGRQFLRFLKPLYPDWDSAFEEQLLKTLDVPLTRKLKDMSRGEQMKARLLSSMAYRPELLILDEPFSGLDPLVREELSQALLELVGESNWTVILATHDVDELERLADHAGFIHRGSVHFSDTTEALQQRFQQVSVHFAEGTALPESAPDPDWLEWRCAGLEARFTTREFEEKDCRQKLETLGSLAHFEHRPLSLREIFVTISRHERAAVAV